jgi:hypothetical protein
MFEKAARVQRWWLGQFLHTRLELIENRVVRKVMPESERTPTSLTVKRQMHDGRRDCTV